MQTMQTIGRAMTSFVSIVGSVVCALATAFASPAAAQQRTTAAFVTTVGVDTISVEQYGRTGSTIRGVWASKSASTGAQLYYYEIVLGANDRPTTFAVLARPAGATTSSAELPSLEIRYGKDTAVFSMKGDASMSKRIAMSDAYPRLGTSVVGIELALRRLHATGVDASSIVVNSPLGPSFDPIKLPVLFVRRDSVRLTRDLVARLDTSGALLDLHDGNRETRRAASLDVNAIVEEWTSSSNNEKPSIQMSLNELQRFVGHYSLVSGVQISIERTGSTLALRSPDGSLDLVAQTAKSFKVAGESGYVEFEMNAAGDVSGLVLVNGSMRQRASRMK
jgi:hypothetical protein